MRLRHLMPVTGLLCSMLTLSASAQSASHKKAETQAELQKEARMTLADARALALRTVPHSTIQAGEIEREGGKLIYSFDMKVAGKSGIEEVNIDAMTSKLVSRQHETPKEERAEAKADAEAPKTAHTAQAAKSVKAKP